MDKLAQKLNAQEIIRANTEADTEELNRLKGQIGEYHECLAKLQRMIEQATEKLQLSKTDAAGMEQLQALLQEQSTRLAAFEEQQRKAQEEQDARLAAFGEQQRKAQEEQGARLAALGEQQNKAQEEQGARLAAFGEQQRKVQEEQDARLAAFGEQQREALRGQLASLKEQLDAMAAQDQGIGGQLAQLEEKLEAGSDGTLEERLSQTEENVHKECVKVYRNVQAVVVEESGKLKEQLDTATADRKAAGSKLGLIFGISVASLIFSLAGLLIQILSILDVKFF